MKVPRRLMPHSSTSSSPGAFAGFEIAFAANRLVRSVFADAIRLMVAVLFQLPVAVTTSGALAGFEIAFAAI